MKAICDDIKILSSDSSCVGAHNRLANSCFCFKFKFANAMSN